MLKAHKKVANIFSKQIIIYFQCLFPHFTYINKHKMFGTALPIIFLASCTQKCHQWGKAHPVHISETPLQGFLEHWGCTSCKIALSLPRCSVFPKVLNLLPQVLFFVLWPTETETRKVKGAERELCPLLFQGKRWGLAGRCWGRQGTAALWWC